MTPGPAASSVLSQLEPELAEAYRQCAERNMLAALNPRVFFGYFSVCADGQGHGSDTTYPGLDWGQSAEALLWLGRTAEVLASWEYEDWEMQHVDRHDLAAMGRVWYLEAWARWRMGDRAGVLASLRRVADVGRANNWSWRERYYSEKTGDLAAYQINSYCEYPANFIRIVHNFLADTPGPVVPSRR